MVDGNGGRSEPLAVGFSPTPTLYRLHWQRGPRQGIREYVRCGADLLLSGLNGDLDAEAKCLVCGNITRLLIVDGKLDGLVPSNALLHVVETPSKSGRIWIECDATHIFDRDECYQKWSSQYKGEKGLVATVEDYHNRLIERRAKRQRLPGMKE